MQRKQLKETRLHLGLTQQQLADRIHMSRTRYVEIENGDNISHDQMVSISGELGIRIAEMIEQYQADIRVIETKIQEFQQLDPFDLRFFERCYEE